MNNTMLRRRSTLFRLIGIAAAAVGIILLAGAVGSRSAGRGPECDTNEQRTAYIRSLGWECEETAADEKEIMLPKEFPEVLLKYNRLQQEAGFDLTQYAGKSVRMYTYVLKNYPAERETLCTLYVYRGRLIGGDLHSASFDGFMKPLHSGGELNKKG